MRFPAALLLALAFVLSGCVAYYPAPYSSAPQPSPYEQSWNAALGAMQDAGVTIAASDRSSGVITGTKDGSQVRVNVRPEPDGGARVEINARGGPNDSAIANLVNRSYDRRMGR